MREILAKMPDDKPIAMPDLCKKLDRADGNVRRDLEIMASLGLVQKVAITQTGRKLRGLRVGWIKNHPI